MSRAIPNRSRPKAIASAWIDEAKRRSAAIERGEMELVDSDEIMARLRARIRRQPGYWRDRG